MDPINQESEQNKCQKKLNTRKQQRKWEDKIIPSHHPLSHKPYIHCPFYQIDGCTLEDESEETFNEHIAGWGAFGIITWLISTPQRKWHSVRLWSDKQHVFRGGTEEGVDTPEEISGSLFRACQAHWTGIQSIEKSSKKRKDGHKKSQF